MFPEKSVTFMGWHTSWYMKLHQTTELFIQKSVAMQLMDVESYSEANWNVSRA